MILVWLGALAIGLSLGLLGSGGSILTVPVLVYLLGQDEKTAIAGSLLIVGTIAFAGGLVYAARGTVHWRSVAFFGIPGMFGTYGGAWLSRWVSGSLQLAIFAAVMLLAAGLMLRPPRLGSSTRAARPALAIMVDGLLVGLLTGFVGVGGGFLIVPALVLLGGLAMHEAVGTSLMIIGFKSMTGFVKYVQVLSDLGLGLDWEVLGVVTGIGVVGSFLGRKIGTRVPQEGLRRGFGVFLVVVAGFILWRTLPGVV